MKRPQKLSDERLAQALRQLVKKRKGVPPHKQEETQKEYVEKLRSLLREKFRRMLG